MLLIQDDLELDETEARKVLAESGEIGELLNEDLHDGNSKRIGGKY